MNALTRDRVVPIIRQGPLIEIWAITENDRVVWKQYPNAAFTLVRTATTIAEADEEVAEEYRLGTFELRENLSCNER